MKIQLEVVIYTVAEKAVLDSIRCGRRNKIIAIFAVVLLIAALAWAVLFVPSPSVSKSVPTPQPVVPTSQPTHPYGIVDFDIYYQCECRRPNGITTSRWLTSLNLGDIYEEDKFDCSQMSAYIEWLLENCGYDAQIAIDEDTLHTWVVFEVGGWQRIYETTSSQVLPGGYTDREKQYGQEVADLYANPDYVLYTIIGIYHWSSAGDSEGLEYFTTEWAWWEALPLVATEFYIPPEG